MGNKQKQNINKQGVLKDSKKVRPKLTADAFVGTYSKLGVPRDESAEQKTKQADERDAQAKSGRQNLENSGSGRQCLDRWVAGECTTASHRPEKECHGHGYSGDTQCLSSFSPF